MPSPRPSLSSPPHGRSARRLLAAAALLVSMLLVGPACSSSPERGDERGIPAEQHEPLDLEAPTATELADAPCGNPDWSRLPDGSAPADAAPVPPPGDDGGTEDP